MSDFMVESGKQGARSFYAWRATNKPAADFPRDMELEFKETFCAGFNKGAGWAVWVTSRLSTALATLDDFLGWLRSVGDGPDVAEVRAAWLRARVGEVDAWTRLDVLLGVDTQDEAEREAAVQA